MAFGLCLFRQSGKRAFPELAQEHFEVGNGLGSHLIKMLGTDSSLTYEPGSFQHLQMKIAGRLMSK